MEKRPDILKDACDAWLRGAELRRRRERCKRYTYGEQWSDTVRTARGYEPEHVPMERSGVKPLTNNLIRQLVKTVVGHYRNRAAEDGTYTRGEHADMARLNNLAELDARLLEEFLISGCAVQRIVAEDRFGNHAVWVENVDMRRFFVNAFSDPRGWDIHFIGQLHDFTFPEVVARFAGGSSTRARELRELFSRAHTGTVAFAGDPLGVCGDSVGFFRPSDPAHCRVIEVWTLDSFFSDDTSDASDTEFSVALRWHCRWLAPDGTLLAQGPSPYAHASHPYQIKFYPLTDGEVHSFVEDVIDQQRCINRMVVLIDKMMATSAKGVLLFPIRQMVDNMSWTEITERWAQSDGVIPISGQGEFPRQVVSNPAAGGAYQLLELQMKLFDDISGVGEALAGRAGGTARGVEMLQSQIRAASIGLRDVFDTFSTFVDMRNAKALATIRA